MGEIDQQARLALVDAVHLWRLTPAIWAEELIASAANCLVADLDSPSLRILAGVSPRESAFVVEELVAATLSELDVNEVRDMNPKRGALEAMLRRFEERRVTTRELSSWAHRTIGHEGPDDCQVFVLLDDVYDDWEDAGLDMTDLTNRAHLEAQAFLGGRPSPGLIV